MISVAKLRLARATGTTAYADYLKQYPRYPERAFLFVEGKDDCSFYAPRVEQRRRYVHIPCGNKDGVLVALSQIRSNRAQARECLFFTDKDLWDFLGLSHVADSSLFVTHGYSFENYLVTPDTVERVWTEIVGLPLTHPLWPHWEGQFPKQQAEFARRMLPIMAWVLDIRARGIRCHLDQFKLGEVFHVMGDGSIHQRPNTGIAKWESWCISDSNYVRSTTGIRAALIRLKAANTKRWLRGKWELWLLQEFLRAMIQDVRARVAGHRVSCEINAGNIVHLLAPRALAVAELENFLDSALPSAES